MDARVRPTDSMWFKGALVLVRRLQIDDIGPHYVRWFEDEFVRRFIKYAREAPKLEDLVAYFRRMDQRPDVDFLGLFDPASGRHIGNMKFETGPCPDEMHVGFLIGQAEFRNRGVLRECIPACISHAQMRRKLRRVYLTVDPNNNPGLSAFTRLGFKPTAIIDAQGDLEMDYVGAG